MNYVEFVTGSVKNRGNIVPVNQVKINGTDIDCYRSVFLFFEDLKRYVEETKSVSGFAGAHIADALIFDFDGNPTELGEVRNTAADFVLYMENFYEVPRNFIRIAFSGFKGFHISIPFQAVCERPKPSKYFDKIYRGIAQDITEGLKYLDMAIYEKRRIFRLTNTKHSKSGSYKIPLTFDELQSLSIDEIRELAKQPRKDFEHKLPVSEISEVPALKDLYVKWSNHKFTEAKKNEKADYSELLRGVSEGGRSNAAIKLTGHYIRLGMSEEEAIEHIRLWNTQNNPPLEDKQVEEIVRGAFRRYAQPINDNITDYFYSPERAFNERYKPYVKDSEKNRVRTGFEKLDKQMRSVRAGEVLCLQGKTGNAKSAFVQNIGHNYAKQSGEPILFFSLEMPIVSVIERSFQIETGLSGYDVENETLRLLNNEPSKLSMQAKIVFASIKNFYTIEKSGLTLEQIKQFVRFGEENIYKRKTGLVLIDYLSLLDGRGKDIYEQTSRLARELKDVAKELNVPVIFLTQVTKGKGEYDELEIDSGRDSGAIAEGADFVLGIWKNEEREDVIEYTIGISKNRRGKTGKISVQMDRRSLRFEEKND